MEMAAPGFELALIHTKGHMSGPEGAVQRNCAAIDHNLLALGLVRVKDEQGCFPAIETPIGGQAR